MNKLEVTIAPQPAVEVPRGISPIFVDAVYTRLVEGKASAGVSDLPNTVQETIRTSLDDTLHGSFHLADVKPDLAIEFRFLDPTGSVRLKKTQHDAGSVKIAVQIDQADVAAITAPKPQPVPSAARLDRHAYFIVVNDIRVPFSASKLQVGPITVGGGGWKQLGLDKLFQSEAPLTTSVQFPVAGWPGSGNVTLMEIHLAVDGQFGFSFEKGAGDAWLWWLSGPLPAIGLVLDNLGTVRTVRIGVALPPFSAPAPATDVSGQVPRDVTEAELLANPDIYTEDAGAFCQPFKNPERVLGERSFSVILRVEQPVISAQASVVVDPIPTLGVKTPVSGVMSTAERIVEPPRVPVGSVVSGTPDTSFLRHGLPTPYLDMLLRFDRGRTTMDADHPMQWESDLSRYQATTVARGHILEFRTRWRSNGYSLGTVAKTLTLAPRQTRRIQKIEWQRTEAARREETTQLRDQVADTLSQSRQYDDAVQANLSEWSRGHSHSWMKAGAGGFGFAAAGFVIGGGGGGSSASSTATQEGGRRTSANETQRLNDSIRRFGDSLRKLESVVVTEVTQEEAATGTTEVLRNQNYAHSLTVIYYQILRHLKVETAIAGVRECLFVPFPIRPFTVARAYRWRDLIKPALLDPAQAKAIDYLKDVLTQFVNSDTPVGRRSDQPIRYVFGSIFVQLAIERPKDKDDGSFDPATWVVLSPFLGSPAFGVFAKLKELAEAQRDIVFQRDEAPRIAAGWVQRLTMSVGEAPTPVSTDFTLATRYQFNSVVRVDFTIPVGQASITREAMSSILVKATKNLPPGSVANLQSLSFTYETDQFQHSVTASQGSEDLVIVETGVPDTAGATIRIIPDAWERRDIRAEMTHAVENLIEHLNDHVVHYTNTIMWHFDRDALSMMIDGFFVPGTKDVSIASVVERDPIAIIGNCLVFRVAAGSFLGFGDIETPADLFNHYVSLDVPSEPILVSLPTDGLYAQAIMDECSALEEHLGNTDWALNQADPELGTIAPELLQSRQSQPVGTQPTPFPQTLINLQNAPEMPAPTGLSGALNAVQNANAFRDMAGLAGTQANAAAGFQTAASLAASFGAQAAALKLAEAAKKADATQKADQKIATVQHARAKGLITPAEAQRHTSGILENMYKDAPSPLQEGTIPTAMNKVVDMPGSTFEAATSEGQVKFTTASYTPPAAGGATPSPALSATDRVDGLDTHYSPDLPTWSDLLDDGIRFIILRSTESDTLNDNNHPAPNVTSIPINRRYSTRHDDARAAGLMVGAYHFYWADKGSVDQANNMIRTIERVLPGDLPPSFDFEHKGLASDTRRGAAWLNPMLDFLDRIEIALGRCPMIYTSRQVWHDFIKADPAFVDFNRYPLWVKFELTKLSDRYPNRVSGSPPLPAPWSDWTFWQYSLDFTPVEFKNLRSADAQQDLDVCSGGIYMLRGLADLGHTAPHVFANTTYIAYTEPDGSIHLRTQGTPWWDENLTNQSGVPLAAGDVAAVGTGDDQVLVYRSRDDGHIYALSRKLSDPNTWTPTDISVAAGTEGAFDDPFVAVVDPSGSVAVVHWDTNDHYSHLMTDVDGNWHGEDMNLDQAALKVSGSAVVYWYAEKTHIVGRADQDGHLFDFYRVDTSPKARFDDLTATIKDANGNLISAANRPLATYRPSVYMSASGKPCIIFRALRGDIWQIARDSLVGTNLTTAANAPKCAGSPSALKSSEAHVLYRTKDGKVIDLYDDGGTWKHREVPCDVRAAADPTAYLDGTNAAVTYRAVDGTIDLATLANGVWTCEDTTPPVGDLPTDGSTGTEIV